MRLIKNKWLVFLLIITIFVLLSLNVRNVSLAQRGIVLGIGIDKESDEYIVTCEILAPSNLGAQNYQKNRLLTIERGKTLDEAFEKMDKALGVRVSLRHTVLIVLGNSILKGGEYGPLLDLFVGGNVSDNTYIVGVESEAKELFNAKPPLYSTISYKIAETFRSPDIESGMVTMQVKDFFKRYLEKSESIFIPLVEVGKGNMSESNGSGKESETDSINFGKIAVLDRSGLKLVLDDEQSEGLSYIYSNVNEANLYVDIGQGGFDVDIIDTTCQKHFKKADNSLTLDVKMWVKMGSLKSDYPSDHLVSFNGDERELAGKTIEKAIKSAYLVCHQKGVDILGIATGFYKIYGEEYKTRIGDDYLDKTPINVKVTLIVK